MDNLAFFTYIKNVTLIVYYMNVYIYITSLVVYYTHIQGK